LVLGSTIPDFRGAFGAKGEVDPIRHLIGTAAAWGGNPEKDATYLNVTPARNDGATVHKVTVKDVPVDGFWSVSLYNTEGYFVKNAADAYVINDITAKKDADGSVTIQFAAATETSRTACRSCRAGTTRCASIARAPKSSTARGRFRRRS